MALPFELATGNNTPTTVRTGFGRIDMDDPTYLDIRGGTPGDTILTDGAAGLYWGKPPGKATTYIGVTPPLSPAAGDLWFDSNSGQLFIYYTDIDSSAWVAANSLPPASQTIYAISFSFVGGVLPASQLLGLHRLPRALRFPANFTASTAGATANATASTVITVARALAVSPTTFSSIGTLTFAAGSITPTFATTGGLEVACGVGDVISLTGPASPDATLANVYVTLVAGVI